MNCIVCEKPIPDLRASHGSIYDPVCEECHTSLQEEFSQPCYGLYVGGDPRKFTPDGECSTEEEIALYKAVCAEWDAGNYSRNLPHGMIGVNNG